MVSPAKAMLEGNKLMTREAFRKARRSDASADSLSDARSKFSGLKTLEKED